MPTYDALRALPDGVPGPWGESVDIAYDQRDVLLYAVGIGIENLRYVYERHPDFSVFPTFPIRWGSAGAPIDETLIPRSPLPLMIDAERYLSVERPLPPEGTVSVQSRVIGIHPRGKGNGFVECETTVTDADGNLCVRMANGSFRRGVKELGDIEPFEGSGQTYSAKVALPDAPPDVGTEIKIPRNQAHIYRLSGDYNALHIDPDAARFGGFDKPILHGLCTFGYCAQMLLGALCNGDAGRFRTIKVRFSAPVYPGDTLQLHAWSDGAGRVLFEVCVDNAVVVSNAYFEFDPD
jgi:3-hydroxyacyl-CoA dehydrogenase/3a,7a,12a-trihydroxy-5b-cholest-24-enoyl-CoA hydratase